MAMPTKVNPVDPKTFVEGRSWQAVDEPPFILKLISKVKDSPRTREEVARSVLYSQGHLLDLLRRRRSWKALIAHKVALSVGYQIHLLPIGLERPPTDMAGVMQIAKQQGFMLVPIEAPDTVNRHEYRTPDNLLEALQLAQNNARIIIRQQGQDLAAVIPMSDLRRLEQARPK